MYSSASRSPEVTVTVTDRKSWEGQQALGGAGQSIHHGRAQTKKAHVPDNDFLSAVLTPGSSLNPTFLLIVDGVLALLALALVSLIVAPRGSVHSIALLLVERALWVSIKW